MLLLLMVPSLLTVIVMVTMQYIVSGAHELSFVYDEKTENNLVYDSLA